MGLNIYISFVHSVIVQYIRSHFILYYVFTSNDSVVSASRSGDPAALFEEIHDVFSMCFVEIRWISSFNLNTLPSQ